MFEYIEFYKRRSQELVDYSFGCLLKSFIFLRIFIMIELLRSGRLCS